MKKIVLSVLVLILLTSTMLLTAGCSATKDVENATTFLEDYFDELDDEDYDEVIDMFDDDLLDELGGKDATLNILVLRRKTAGKIEDYKIDSSEFYHQNGQTEVTFKVKTTYKHEQDSSEEYTIFVDGEDISFYGIDLSPLSLHDKLLGDFANAYKSSDVSNMTKLIMPIYFDYSTEQDIADILTFVKDYAGQFEEYSIMGEDMLLSDIDDKAFALFEVHLMMDHTDMDIVARVQYCEQDGAVGVSFIELVPAPCLEISNTYFSAIKENNVDKIMSLYNIEVFDNIEGGASDWKEYLASIINEGGEFQGYETTQWYTERVMMESGLEEDVIVVINHATYDAGTLEDVLGITYKNGVYEILFHQISPMQ